MKLHTLLLARLNDRIWDLFRGCKIADVFTRCPVAPMASELAPPMEELPTILVVRLPETHD